MNLISRKRLILRIVGLFAAMAAIGVSGWGYRAIVTSLEAEKTLHAYYLVLDILKVYLHEHPGMWPTTWEDLACLTPKEKNSVFEWPDDLPKIQRRIRIDFGLTLGQVSEMDVSNFSAVQQIGPNYGPHESRIREILLAVRQDDRQSNDALQRLP